MPGFYIAHALPSAEENRRPLAISRGTADTLKSRFKSFKGGEKDAETNILIHRDHETSRKQWWKRTKIVITSIFSFLALKPIGDGTLF